MFNDLYVELAPNWKLALFLWPALLLVLATMGLMAFWPQVSDRARRLMRAVGGRLRGRSAQDGKSNHC